MMQCGEETACMCMIHNICDSSEVSYSVWKMKEEIYLASFMYVYNILCHVLSFAHSCIERPYVVCLLMQCLEDDFSQYFTDT